MHHGTPESCSVCLLPCMFLSPFITGCLLRFFFLLFAFILTLFLLFIYSFICFLPSKELLSHQPLNLSIFCHGKKALKLIAPSVYYMPPPAPSLLHLLVSLSSSPSVCVFPITFLRIELLLLVTSVSSANAVPVSQHSAKANFGNSSILQFSIRCSCGVSFGTQCRGLVFSFLDRSHF